MSYQLPTHCPHKPISITKNHPRSHNLNIHSYSLEELLGIFDLSYDISLEDMKRAKKKVLMVHPDKSQLPPDYFLFYKQAYEMILDFYNNKNRSQQQQQPDTAGNGSSVPMEYQPIYQTNKQTSNQIQGVVKSMNGDKFQNEFNRLYEQYMYEKPDESRNDWFKEDAPSYTYEGKVSASNMSNAFQDIKKTHQQNMLMNYRGVSEMNSAGASLSSYHDVPHMGGEDNYVSSDPFGKLKYEDLRKVHKDQTIFAVSERDLDKMPQYANLDDYNRSRSVDGVKPMEKQQAEAMLSNKQREQYELMMKREHEAKLRMMKNEEKNRIIQSKFLQLENRK